MTRAATFALFLLAATAGGAAAHVSERAIVLLLPTGYYRAVGVAAVVATLLLTVFLPPRAVRALFPAAPGSTLDVGAPAAGPGSALSFLILAGLVAIGFLGPHDPLDNLLPLSLFTLWWICMVALAAAVGNFWHWFNPWAAPLRWAFGGRHRFALPARIGQAPAILGYGLFALYYLGDPAPADPARLARVAAAYWGLTFALGGLFGPGWLQRGECFTVLFDLAGRLSPFDWRARRVRFFGRDIVSAGQVPLSLGLFCVTLLAIGSFDGLNETFWWMAKIGINPLAFPGRSAVVWENRIGMLAAIVLLNLVLAACVWLGAALAGARARFVALWAASALAVLPIALAYHVAHYLTSVLVSVQYWVGALNDPLDSGAHLLGMDHTRITTSFFNRYRTERAIWLTQAGVIVAGHMLAVVLAHGVALRHVCGPQTAGGQDPVGAQPPAQPGVQPGAHGRALRSQLFVAAFMVAYTFFGLWLLASPTAT